MQPDSSEGRGPIGVPEPCECQNVSSRRDKRRKRCGEVTDYLSRTDLGVGGQVGHSPRRFLVAPINNQSFAMPPQATEGPQTEGSTPSFFRVPPPIKQLFDRFPLTTYPANDLPQRVPSGHADNQLFVFSDAASARRGRPSFNPQCLKWQVSLLSICKLQNSCL